VNAGMASLGLEQTRRCISTGSLPVKINQKCARAVAAILGTHAAGAAYAAATPDQSEGGVQEVVVTAQRRSENAQDVPIAIQAFTGDTLQQLNVTNFDDLLKYLPNVVAPSAGPGQDQIFMRGLSAGNVATQSGGSINGLPNVAIYLDEQSGQLPGRNLDVYTADLERVEVLEGPQGTLFGAGAQAGVIRYITNKPKLNVTEGSVSGSYGVTAGGDPNTDVTAVLNLPLIADKLAGRGVFYQMPKSSDGVALPKQSVTLFNNSYNTDRFENTALTINGRIGALRAVYAGSYLVRNLDTVQDYTNYARGLYADYYQCHAADPANGLAASCFSPSSVWNETERNAHQSHELRLSTPDDWRMRGIAGAFWEDLRINDQLNWLYKTLPPCTATVTLGCLTNIGPVPGSDVNNPAPVRNDNVAFFNDVKRGYRQRALFTSVDLDLVPKVLTITAGTRYYHFDNEEVGAESGSFSCYQAGLPPCLTSGATVDIGKENLHTIYKGFKSRANLTWHIWPDVLTYFTWSQGFRAGAFNRSFACYLPDASGVPQYCSPLPYASDNLTNDEFGWKTEFLDHRLQWNGAIYKEDWKNVQVSFFDPGVLGNVGFNTNGPDYRIRGVETSVIAVLAHGLTAQGGASWNRSEQN